MLRTRRFAIVNLGLIHKFNRPNKLNIHDLGVHF